MIKSMRSSGELRQFQTAYYERAGHAPDLDVLMRDDNRVYGLYVGGSLVGGFVLGTKVPFRAVETIPDAETREYWYAILSGHKAVDVGLVWMARDLAEIRRALLWLAVLRRVRASGADRVVVRSDVEKLADAYRRTFVNAVLEYEGPNVVDGLNIVRAWQFAFERPSWTVYFRMLFARRAVRHKPRRRG